MSHFRRETHHVQRLSSPVSGRLGALASDTEVNDPEILNESWDKGIPFAVFAAHEAGSLSRTSVAQHDIDAGSPTLYRRRRVVKITSAQICQ